MLVQIIKRHGWNYLLAKIFPGILGFIAVPLFTNLYGFKNYGEIMLLIALCNMITVFSSGWLAQSWVRFQMKGLNEKNIIIAITYSIFIASALCLISFFINFDNNNFSLIFKLYNYGAITLMTVGMVLYYLIVSALQALLLSKYVL